MATIVNWYVDPDATGSATGVDWANAYTSLQAWETAQAADITLATGSDEIYIVNCRSSSGTADALCVIAGWTLSVDNYILIQCTGVNRHKGLWSDSLYRIIVTSGSGISVSENFVRIEGLQIHLDGTATGQCINSASTDATDSEYIFDSNILRGPSAGADGTLQLGIYARGDTTGTYVISNNIFYDFDNTNAVNGHGIRDGGSFNDTHLWINNTCYNVSFPYGQAGTTHVKCVNNICEMGPANPFNDGYFDGGGWSTGSQNNHTSEVANEIPPTNAVTETTVTFKDSASDDFHLSSADTALIGAGVGTATDSDVPTTDIDGDTRSGTTTDIGADLFMAGLIGTKINIEKNVTVTG